MKNNSAPEVKFSGKIPSLPFGGNSTPFGIMFVPKVPLPQNEPQLSTTWDLIPDVRLYRDSESSPLYLASQRPEPEFSEMIIWYIPNTTNNQAIFADYDVYWQSAVDRPEPSTSTPSANVKPYIGNDTLSATQGIFTHGELTTLPFGNGTPFKLICIAKGDPQSEPTLPRNMIFLDQTSGPTFVYLQRNATTVDPQWTDMKFKNLTNSAQNQTILANYRIFWMSGEYPPIS